MSNRVFDASRMLIAALISLTCSVGLAAPHSDGELRIEVVDRATGQPIAARMHLKTLAGRPVKLRLPGTAEFGGHFYIDGKLTLPLHVGRYTFELEAGPEYLKDSGHFEIERHADDSKRIEMKRVVDLSAEGWWGGDVDVRRSARDRPLILRAEGLKIAPLSDPKAAKNISPKLEIDGHFIARSPYAWDLPVWLASGKLEAIELINHHSLRGGVVDNENDGRPRDKSFFPGALGNGRWSEAVYYHVLNCGLRIPPVAGSGSGSNDNPVGTNRAYVFCGTEFSKNAWWAGLRAGRVFVTNGPLLRPLVEGHPPGYVFQITAGESINLEIGLNLATSVPVEYLQIVKNGVVDAEVRLADWKNRAGRLPPAHFDDSGWFLVRAVTNNPKVYQFASSGPYYVYKADRPRVSRKSVRFFLDWINAAETRIRSFRSLDDAQRAAMLAKQESARSFFEKLLASANAD
ncbi:MAG TPA: hypothetical protein VFW73_05190 [Lacipirellulaceae bacterium]|nr:hypothetical protein [Lacipirellulaceae bacterium]